MIEREGVRSRARTVPSATLAALRWIRRGLAWGKDRSASAIGWAKSMAVGPAWAFLAGPIETLLLGRRKDVSVATVLVAIALAPAVAWWVATTSGYPPIEEWVVGTWTGTDPHGIVFAGIGLLVGVGTLASAANSGLVPTGALVMAPLFGIGATRYGTRHADPVLGPQVVSLPEAIEFATAVAVLGGVPIAVVGVLLGELLRRGVRWRAVGTPLRSEDDHPQP